jgi:hypothetical protein
VEEASIMGSIDTANVEKVNLMVENRTEKELYRESKLHKGTKGLQRLSQILPTCTSFTHKLPASMFEFKANLLVESD